MTEDQAAEMLTLLTEIRDLMAMGIAASDTDDFACEHPEDQRLIMAARGKRWYCKACEFEYVAPDYES